MDANVFVKAVFDITVRADPKRVLEFSLLQREYHHDFAIIEVQGEQDNQREYRTGAPVQLTWGRSPQGTDDFYGYIDHVVPKLDRKERATNMRSIMVYCLGASWPLKNPVQSVYVGLTTSDAIRDVAAKNFFTTDVTDNQIIWPSLSAAGVSQWDFLVDMAKRSGRTLYCNKTEVRCYDALTTLKRSDRPVPTFYFYDKHPELNTVIDFKVRSGEAGVEDGRQRRIRYAQGIDDHTGLAVFARDDASQLTVDQLSLDSPDPWFDKFETDFVVPSNLLAMQRLDAEARRNRFYIKAHAQVVGDTRVTQGGVVILEGLANKHSGAWYVHAVKHTITKARYVMDLELGRDSEYDDGLRPGPPANVVRPRFDPFGIEVTRTPPTILVNGTWRSSWLAKRPVSGVA